MEKTIPWYRRFSQKGLLLGLILLFSFLIKNPFHTQPFVGHFGSYQSIVAMIAHEYAEKNFTNFLYPNSFTLTAGRPSLEMIYHPIDAFVAAGFWKLFGGNLDYWGRFQAMLFSFLSTIFIYLGIKKIASTKLALTATFLWAFSPMSLIYGRTFMNEAAALGFTAISFCCLAAWSQNGKRILVVGSGLAFSLVLIFRLHFIVLLPAFSWWVWNHRDQRRGSALALFLLSASSLALFWFWHTFEVTRSFTNLHTSLFAQVEARSFPDPLLLEWNFYKTLFKELALRLWGPLPFFLLLGSLGTIFRKEDFWIFLSFIFCGFMVLLGPSKFFDHPFYFLPLLLPGVVLAARGFVQLAERGSKGWGAGLVALILFSNIALFWRPAFLRPADQNLLFEAVEFVKTHTDQGDRIIAAHGGSADFLYYLKRYGYSFNIDGNRKELPRYFKLQKYSRLSPEEFEERNEAVLDSVRWLEYRKDKGGARYFAVVPKTDLDKDLRLKEYLQSNYRLASDPKKNYALYQLTSAS